MDDGMDVEEVEIPLATQHAFLDQAKQYNFVAVKEMVEATPGLVNVQPSGRWSALHQASEAGEELAVRFLLEKGADKTLLTKDGRTALQVAKNAAVRALLGAGEKRAAEVEGYKPAKVAAVAAPVAEVALKVNYVSGEELTSLKWPVTGTVKDLKEELSKYLEPGKVVRSLLKENYALPDGTLQAAGLESEAMLSAVLEAEPALYLFNPCSAAELCERYEDWSAGDDVMVTSDRQHHAMEKAPPEALAVATELRDAMPGLSSHQVCRSSEGDSPGEVLVIVAGEEPRKACLKALRIVVEAEDLNLGDKVNEDDPELKGMWSIATLEQVAWKDYLDKGFNSFPEDTCADLLENGGVEQKELDEFRAGTKVMAEKLQKHFIFGFDDTAVTAPIIYGGYTPEGQIVGVLASRVWT